MKHFQIPFIEATECYYKKVNEKFIGTVVDYMIFVERRLKYESNVTYVHETSKKILMTTCETVLIQKDHIQTEFQNLLDKDKIEDLTRMYGLLSRIPYGLNEIRIIFEAHVIHQGEMTIDAAAVTTDVDTKIYIDALLDVHKKFLDVVNNAFRGETGFNGSLDKACRVFVNRNSICKVGSCKGPEMLAKYCDGVLRKNTKEDEDILNNIVHNKTK